MKVGDRVRYTGRGEPGLSARTGIGQLGIVEDVSKEVVRVKWDAPNASVVHGLSTGVYASNVELVLDILKPMELFCHGETARPVRLIAKTEDGNLMIGFRNREGMGSDNRWYIFSLSGVFVSSETGSGGAITLRNVPQPVTRYHHQHVMVDGKSEALKFTLVDNVVTNVELDRR